MSKVRLAVEEFNAGEHPVRIGDGALVALERALAHGLRPSQSFILGDENTLRLCYGELIGHVPALAEAQTIEVRAGERSKDIEVCRALWSHLAERGADAIPMNVNPATASLYAVSPRARGGLADLFMTHPPLAERVRRLRQLGGGQVAA